MKQPIIPPCLKEGDLVAITATARKVSANEMAPAKALLQSWGLRVIVPDGLYAEQHQMAGSDAHRTTMIQQLLDNPEVKAIFCARGGYGTVRMVDTIHWERFLQHPKWIIGYSDVTVLHSTLRQMQVASIHGIMPINIPVDALQVDYPALASLHQLLFDGKVEYKQLGDRKLFRAGNAQGAIVGGNLSMLYSQLASPSDINTDNTILFIEDLDEYLYHIDRMMMALKRAGKLAHLQGLIVGAMSDMHDNTIPFGYTAEEIVWDAVKEYHYPVVMNCPFGHIGTENRALPLGSNASLTVNFSGEASILCSL